MTQGKQCGSRLPADGDHLIAMLEAGRGWPRLATLHGGLASSPGLQGLSLPGEVEAELLTGDGRTDQEIPVATILVLRSSGIGGG